MNSKKKFSKICSILLIALLVVLSFSSCKKKESETKPVANPSALVNKDAVIQSDENSKPSIVTVPIPVTIEPPIRTIVDDEMPEENTIVESKPVEKEAEEARTNTRDDIVVVETIAEDAPKADNSEKNTSIETNTVPVNVSTTVNNSSVSDLKEEVVEERTEVVKAEEKLVADNVIINDIFSYGGISATIIAKSNETSFIFDEPYPSISFIVNILDEVLDQYPMLYDVVSYEFDGKSLVLTYPEGYFGNSKEELYGNLLILRDIALSLFNDTVTVADNLFSREYQLYGKKVMIIAGLDSAFITSDEAFTQREIYEAIEILKANFPEESQYVFFTLKEDGIELSYPAVDESYISIALDALQDLILAYTPMPLVEIFDETLTAEVPPTGAPQEEITGVVEDKKDEAIFVEPLTDAGKKVTNLSLGLSTKAELDFSYASPFVLGLEVRAEYKITDRFDVGLKLGYDLSAYVPIKGYLKYNFPKPEGLYIFGEAGASIGVGGRPTGLLLGAGIGYEAEVLDNILIFGEAGVTFRTNATKKFSPYIGIGAKYTF